MDLTPSDDPLKLEDKTRHPVKFGHTPLSAAFRFIEPTWRNYIMYIDMESRTGNKEAKRYLEVWQSLPLRERSSHLPEQICDMASVAPSDVIRWVSGQVWIEGSAKSAMCMSFMKDKVLEQTAQYAMASPDNYKHAELFVKAAGMYPQTSKGPAPVSIFNMPVASSNAVAGVRSEVSPVHSSGLRSMDEDIVELSKIMQGADMSVHARAEDMPDDDPDDSEEDEED